MFDKNVRFKIEPFQWSAENLLDEEHRLVAQLTYEALNSGWQPYDELDLKATPTGRQILDLNPASMARLVLALAAHARYFDELAEKTRSLAQHDYERWNWHLTAEWKQIWPSRQVPAQTLTRLLRRKLPLESEHLVALADWISLGQWPTPRPAFLKAVENFAPLPKDDHALHLSLAGLSRVLRNEKTKDGPKLAQRLDELLAEIRPSSPDAPANGEPICEAAEPDASAPAPVGSSNILTQLKKYLGTGLEEDAGATEEIGLDRFPLRFDSPLREEHELLNMLLPEVVERLGYDNPSLSTTEAGRNMLARDRLGKGRLLLALAERCVNNPSAAVSMNNHLEWQSKAALRGTLHRLLQGAFDLRRDHLFDFLLFLSALGDYEWIDAQDAVMRLLPDIEAALKAEPPTPGERHVLHRVRSRTVKAPPFGRPNDQISRIDRFLRDGSFFVLVPGEAWSDAVNARIRGMPAAKRESWVRLFQHTATATSARPSAKWLKAAGERVKEVGTVEFRHSLLQWISLVGQPKTVRRLPEPYTSEAAANETIHEGNATCLRGLLWMSSDAVSPDLVRAFGALAVSCYRKIAGVGPRAVKVGNAAVYALSQVEDPLAIGQLALLKIKVKFGSAQKEIEKAFAQAAERSGLPREELEEMSVPTYGLTEVGLAEEKLGNFTARLAITGTDSTELVWIKPDGKTQRSVPAEIKKSHADDLKELKASAKDIQKMLPAQRDRLDGLFLQQRSWPIRTWRERYLDHPLVGTLARRLLWEFDDGASLTTGIWFEENLVNFDLEPIFEDSNLTVRLWHPIGKDIAEVAAWREWFESQQIRQPFKQAHREIYLLTDAERRTRIYSNRFAAHVLKQHQFNALCGVRGWKNQLRLLVDAEYAPPSLYLPDWGLRAEFWVEGIGDNYGTDTNETGVFLRLSTDQVRFYPIETRQRSVHAGGGGYQEAHAHGQQDVEPIPLEQVPPLVLSEVMRDVDLFVGVASVGNDPTWADGGPEGRYQEYWHNYSFGELSATAKTRREVLGRLVPKLKIANLCRFEEKFLVVKGELRTYKIHLGSGNILMEPNDQYLCIVPKQNPEQDLPVLLPFEGDRTLSLIISKAFLLANDVAIKDPSIVSQIKPR